MRRIVRAIMAMTVRPNSKPISRVLSRMSPFSTWLNSCAMTPCSSSRSRFTSAPRVTAIAAFAGLYPAANALIPASRSSRYTCGTGTPEAIAISSTTLRRRRLSGSAVSAPTRVPPSCSAILLPPAASETVRATLEMPIVPSTPMLVNRMIVG